MHSFNQLTFRNYFAALGDKFVADVSPLPLQGARLISVNPQAANLLELDLVAVETELLQLLDGTQLPENAQPTASVYSGHQFGHYNPQLGDGRALLIGQIENSRGELWELQIKGAGPTPFSRRADGRAVLRSSIREYLCSEAMHSLGIASTRALAICSSETQVLRENLETASCILRTAPSHVRFGHFEYFFYTQQHEQLQILADFIIQHHFVHLTGLEGEEKYQAFLCEVVERTALMIAQWQCNGFCHGVMNSDNMSILGLTIDYGPFGFLDDFNPGFICNHSDHQGRYAYNQQINIGLWNLNALAHSLSPLISSQGLKDALSLYEPAFLRHFSQQMQQKLGLLEEHEGDAQLIQQLLQLLASQKIDYSYFFRRFSHYACGKAQDIRDHFIDRAAFDSWFVSYQQRVAKEKTSNDQRLETMLGCNPKFILRNYLAQWAIDDAERGNYQTLNDLLAVLQSPFAEHGNLEKFAKLPPDWGKKLQVSCSS